MTNPQYPSDPYGGDQGQGNIWEQSQPTGNVWDPQATDAWNQQQATAGMPQTPAPTPAPTPPPPPGPPSPLSPAAAPQPPQPSPNNFFSALFDFSVGTRFNNAAIRLAYLVIANTALLLAIAIIVFAIVTQNALFIVISILLAPMLVIAGMASMRVRLQTYRAVAGNPENNS